MMQIVRKFTGLVFTREMRSSGKDRFCAFVALACVLLGADAARATEADPLADAVHYIKFDGDLNGDGILQAGEIRDVRYWGSTNLNGSTRPFTNVEIYSNTLGKPCWTNATVLDACRGVTRTGQVLSFRCDEVDSAGASGSQQVILKNQAVTGDVTVIVRVRVDTFAPKGVSTQNDFAWLAFNGEAWNSDATLAGGTTFGFKYIQVKSGSSTVTVDPSTNAYPLLMAGASYATTSNIRLTTNVWYDIAYTIHDNGNNTADWFMLVRDPSPATGIGSGANKSYQYKTASGTLKSVFYPTSMHGTDLRLGAEGNGRNKYAGKGVSCDLDRLVMWHRVLTKDEILRVLMRDSTTFSVGVRDGKAGEFGDPSETPAAFEADNDAWHRLPDTITAERPAWSFSFTPRSSSHVDAAHVLRLSAAAGDAGETVLGLEVNGRMVKPDQSVGPGGTIQWDIRQGYLQTGANAFRIIRRPSSTAASLKLDAFDLGGSWTVGTFNYEFNEFSIERANPIPCVFYPGDWRFGGCQRGAVTTENCDTDTFRFYVREGYEQYGYRYRMRALGHGGGAERSSWPLAAYLNGSATPGFEVNVLGNLDCAFDIPPYTLTNGWNTIKVKVTGAASEGGAYWINFDAHQLMLKPRTFGLTLILR